MKVLQSHSVVVLLAFFFPLSFVYYLRVISLLVRISVALELVSTCTSISVLVVVLLLVVLVLFLFLFRRSSSIM
jgi:hypothetical protein